MGLKGKLTGEVEMSSHGHHVHELFAKRPHHISQISSHVQSCEIHEGEFGKTGSSMNWNYIVDGKECVAKAVVEKLEETETGNIVVFKVVEGHLIEEYTYFVAHLHATKKEVKWVFEYEKRSEDVPHPTKLLDFILNVNKNIDDHHVNA